jgi:hypothetical protein
MQIYNSHLVSQFISNSTTSNTAYCDISTLLAALSVTYSLTVIFSSLSCWIHGPHCVNELLGNKIQWWIATWKLYCSPVLHPFSQYLMSSCVIQMVQPSGNGPPLAPTYHFFWTYSYAFLVLCDSCFSWPSPSFHFLLYPKLASLSSCQ